MAPTRRQILKWSAAVPILAFTRRLLAAAPSSPIRISGPESPHQQLFDRAMRQFMEAQSISAGHLAIFANDALVLNHGYINLASNGAMEPLISTPIQIEPARRGHGEPPARRSVTTESIFRLASCSKIFTCAAITQLHGAGKLTLEEHVFPLLGIHSPALRNQRPDPRIEKIMVKHLVDHAGGWISGGPLVAKDGKPINGSHFDPVFEIRRMSLDLNLARPLSKFEMARYMYGRPLQFEPGSQDFDSTGGRSYSNFGYVLLGMVVEKITGKSFVEFLREPALAKDGTDEVFLARTSAAERMPKEIWYEDPSAGPSALAPRSEEKVPFPYGGEGWLIERMDSGGGLATTAATLARFISRHAVWGLGGRAAGCEREGSMAGTTSYTFSRRNGVDCAVIFNTRHFANPRQRFEDFTAHLRSLLDQLSS